MNVRIASGIFAVAVVLLAPAPPAAGTGRPQQAAERPYGPMEPFPVDSKAGGFAVRVGSGLPDEYGRRAFLADAEGNLEVAVQYQAKLPVNYGPGGELCRVVVQSVRVPGCCGDELKIEHVVSFDPFAVVAGQHVNDVVVVKIPPPSAPEKAAVRVVLEILADEGRWETQAVKTAPIIPL